jgi:hypothetical protein
MPAKTTLLFAPNEDGLGRPCGAYCVRTASTAHMTGPSAFFIRLLPALMRHAAVNVIILVARDSRTPLLAAPHRALPRTARSRTPTPVPPAIASRPESAPNHPDDRTPSASERLEAFHNAAALHYADTERVHVVRLKLEHQFRHGPRVALRGGARAHWHADGRARPQARQAH